MGKDLKGKNLGRGLCQRKDGIYVGRISKNNKRYVVYDKNLNNVKVKLKKIKLDLEKENNISEITLTEWFEEFLILYKEGKIKGDTLYRYRQNFQTCEAISMMKLKDIKAMHIQKMINDLVDKGISYGTLNNIRGILKELFQKALGNELVNVNPLEAVVLPKKQNKERRYLKPKEQEMFLEGLKGYAHEDIFLADLCTGCRIGELLGLKWSDIDFVNKTISIERSLHYGRLNDNEKCHFYFTTTKNEMSTRIIPMLPETESILNRVYKKQLRNKTEYKKKWKQEKEFENMVFTTQHGQPIRDGDVNRTIKTVVDKVNLLETELAKEENREPFLIEPFSAHCFRHTFVTRCRENNVPYEVIQKMVGHSNKEMTEYYNHAKIDVDFSELERVSFIGDGTKNV